MSDESAEMIIQVNSGDPKARGTPQAFSTDLPYPIVLDNKEEYEVCVFDIQFNDRQRPAGNPPYLSVYVNSNLVNGNTIIGSQTTNAVMWISWTHLYSDSISINAGAYYTVYLTTEKNRKWYPLANLTQIKTVDVSLTLSTGVPIPFNFGLDFTSISFAIRKKQ